MGQNSKLKRASKVRARNKDKSKVRREVDLDLGIKPPKSIVFTSKKIYNRKKKHRKDG